MRVVVTLILLGALTACADSSDERSGASSGALRVQEPCASDQSFIAWCGYKNPEDLALTPDGNFLLATGFGGVPNPLLNEITLIDLGSMERRVIEIVLSENSWGSAECARTTTDFSTHGLDIVQRQDGRHMVAMTNHLPAETVELFELAPVDNRWQLVWRGCVEAPSLNSGGYQPLFNDVALTAEGSLYVTEMYNGKMPFEALIEAGLMGANTGQCGSGHHKRVFAAFPGLRAVSPMASCSVPTHPRFTSTTGSLVSPPSSTSALEWWLRLTKADERTI
jgi:hypothetical protein